MRWLWLALLVFAETATGETLSGTVEHVIDGDTLTVREAGKRRYRVRLAGVDAPEAKQAFGLQAARSLAKLCHRKSATVDWKERLGGLHLGHVICDGTPANAEQVRRGMAWVSPRHTTPGSTLYEQEAYARLRRIGLWADDKAVPPWEWRAHPSDK